MYAHIRLAVLTFTLAAGSASLAAAADMNTYRAGQAYLKSAAKNPNQCAVQCQGDAQCRGWNFVVPNMNAKSGICEFNARIAAPTYSAISVSGAAQTDVDPLMSRAVNGGTRTIRVGSAQAASARAAVRQAPKSRRIVKRNPVPAQNRSLAPASLKTPIGANAQTPRMYGRQPAPAPQAAQPAPSAVQQGVNQPLTREQAFYRQQYFEAQKRQALQMQQRAQRQAAYQRAQQFPVQQAPVQRFAPQVPVQQVAPQFPGQYGQMPAMPGVNTPAPNQVQRPQIQQPQGPRFGPQQAPQPGQIFGSLHDDLTKMTPVPRPAVAPDNPANPNAPISTATPAPTKPVQTQALKQPILQGLAGG